MICGDIWNKYHEWYFKIVIHNFILAFCLTLEKNEQKKAMTISFFLLSSKLKQKKSLEHNQKSDKNRVSINNKDSKTLISLYLPVKFNSGA